jgi:hypothetical protein
MSELRFETTIGEDRVIHLPDEFNVPPGRVEVIVVPQVTCRPSENTQLRALIDRLGHAAKIAGIAGLPKDMAENHTR